MRTAAFRVGVAAAGGLLAAVLGAFVLPWQADALAGWAVTAVIFLTRVWRVIAGMPAADTRRVAKHEDPSRFLADALVLTASVGCLVGVGFAVVKAHQLQGGREAALLVLTVASVLLSWMVVHTVFTLHYARIFYGDPEPDGGIEFGDTKQPSFIDFAYVAFTVGMTYQVSDTNLTTQAMRRTALRHALLSFLFGTFILALTINVLAGSLGGAGS
jgi:uncharacterized membrane protein